MDPDGKERRHILYSYSSGREIIPAKSSDVRSLVASIMRGPNVVKQGDAAFAWNACATNAAAPEFKVGDKFAPSDDRGMTLTVGKVEKHPTWGWVYYAKGVSDSWYTADEMVRK